MSLMGSPQWMYASGEDFTIDQSLRLQNTSPDYSGAEDTFLKRIWSQAPTDADKFTYALWVKRSDLDLESANAQYWLLGVTATAESNIKFYQENY